MEKIFPKASVLALQIKKILNWQRAPSSLAENDVGAFL